MNWPALADRALDSTKLYRQNCRFQIIIKQIPDHIIRESSIPQLV
jgi:hypothetical protein